MAPGVGRKTSKRAWHYSMALRRRFTRACAVAWAQWPDEDFAIRDPQKVRENHLRDEVCGVIVEGLCVPWDLSFPPVHCVTGCLGNSLYDHSDKFKNVLCGEIYSRCRQAPYDIAQDDALLERDLIVELAAEIERVAPPGGTLWANENYSNLYLLLHHATEAANFRVLASYH